jgi:hypothetical protein
MNLAQQRTQVIGIYILRLFAAVLVFWYRGSGSRLEATTRDIAGTEFSLAVDLVHVEEGAAPILDCHSGRSCPSRDSLWSRRQTGRPGDPASRGEVRGQFQASFPAV